MHDRIRQILIPILFSLIFGCSESTNEEPAVEAIANEETVGVITTPAEVAQAVANSLIEAGITSILNFAPAMLRVPHGVQVRQVDLATELQILSFYMAVGQHAAG